MLAVVGYHARAPFLLGGGRGVDVFFVLSGGLITSLLLKTDLTIGDFWRRRGLRLVPALLVMISAVVAVTPWLWPAYTSHAPRDGLLAATYTMNFAEAWAPHDNPFMHTWSLAAEVQFYLAWPFILPWLARHRPNLALPLLWAILAALQLLRPPHWETYYFPHFSGLALGAATVFIDRGSKWMSIGGFALVLLGFVDPRIPSAAVEAGAAAMILGFREPSALRDLFRMQPLVQIGLISYGIYLWHFPIHMAFESQPWFIRGSAASVGGLLLGAASYRLIERPLAGMLRPAPALQPGGAAVAHERDR